MIGLALLFAVTAPVASALPAPVVDSEEIVVLARKLRALQIHFSPSKKNGVFAAKGCRVMKSTDDPEIDAIGCAAAEHCSAPGFATQSLFVACIKSWGRQQIVALADRRSLARDAQ